MHTAAWVDGSSDGVLPRVTGDMATLVNRVIAGYALFVQLPALPLALAQIPGTAWWWNLVGGLGMAGSVGWLVVNAWRRSAMGPPVATFAGVLLAAVLTGPSAFPVQDRQVWVWFAVGVAGVAVAVTFGIRWCVVYSVVLAVAFVRWRLHPTGGGADVTEAVSEAVMATVASLVIGATGLGMVQAARAADQLGSLVYRRELASAVERALADERSRLDRLIHDDVMTTLVAAAHASDSGTTAGARRLAVETLARIDATGSGEPNDGSLGLAAFAALVAGTARRVSPSVTTTDEGTLPLPRQLIPVSIAEAFLTAMREAVRNAVRHAAASEIRVRLSLSATEDPAEHRLELTIEDDGRGFDSTGVAAARLGIPFSIVGALAAVGGRAEIQSTVGAGTRVILSGPMPAEPGPIPPPTEVAGAEPLLPAEFPVRLLVGLTWVDVVAQVLVGLLNLGQMQPRWPVLIALGMLVPFNYLVFQRGSRLQLPWGAAALAAGLAASVATFVYPTLQPDREPGSSDWYLFALQVGFVGLVLRRRPGWAMLALAAVAGWAVWWAEHSSTGSAAVLMGLFGPVSFVVMALLVARLLTVVARREVALRSQDAAAIEDSARRHVAVVQRSLWLADLRQTVRQALIRIATVGDDVPEPLRSEALVLEAGLRDGLSARNVMSEELADIADAARRRGVSVTFVDSRQTPVPDAVGQAVVAELRDALSSRTVSRLVVRLGPDGRRQLASVVTEDEGDLSMTTIDAAGVRARDGRSE